MTDQEIVRQFLQSRTEHAFELLYDRYTPVLYRFALRMVGPDAEDVIQEAWIRAIGRLDGFRGESTLRTWLIGITLNCAREYLRQAKRTPALDGEPPLLQVSPATSGAQVDLERALARLDDVFRETFLLHEVEGLTHDEISQLLGISPGTSKSRVSRARRQLRMHLHADFPHDTAT